MPRLLATFAFLLRVATLAVATLGIAPLGDGQCSPDRVSYADGFERTHRCVTTSHVRAQAAFDEGLTLLYAFNPEQARVAFEAALADDPALAIAWWGVAQSHGPNINTSYDPAEQRRGREAAAKAATLAATASPAERALIAAVAKRFAYDRPADANRSAVAYRDAMDAAAVAFPNDDDIVTLSAEAEMDVHPWSYFTTDGNPTPGTLGLIAALRAVLARTPQHIGANHFAIHAFEESRHPEDAAPSARRLAAMHFEPAAEHLTHMPAHTFMRIGAYHEAGEANARALASYDTYLMGEHAGHADYYGHNCAFGINAFMMSGERARASTLADSCGHGGERRQIVDLRFRDWTALAEDDTADGFPAAMLLAHDGRLELAQKHLLSLRSSSDATSAIESAVLEASIARAKGSGEAEIAALQHAVELQDGYGYSEPPAFWFPVRETLGGAFLRANRYAEAERTFRADLERNAENPRSLFGLADALEHQARAAEASAVRIRFARAWAQADAQLDAKEL